MELVVVSMESRTRHGAVYRQCGSRLDGFSLEVLTSIGQDRCRVDMHDSTSSYRISQLLKVIRLANLTHQSGTGCFGLSFFVSVASCSGHIHLRLAAEYCSRFRSSSFLWIDKDKEWKTKSVILGGQVQSTCRYVHTTFI